MTGLQGFGLGVVVTLVAEMAAVFGLVVWVLVRWGPKAR